jgi:hypothetical protein
LAQFPICCDRNFPKVWFETQFQNSVEKVEIRPKSEIRAGIRKSRWNSFYIGQNWGMRFFPFRDVINVPLAFFFFRGGFLEFLELTGKLFFFLSVSFCLGMLFAFLSLETEFLEVNGKIFFSYGSFCLETLLTFLLHFFSLETTNWSS